VIALITHLVKHRKEHGRYLIVVPASILPHWMDEIARFSPELSVAAYCGPFDERSIVWEQQVWPGRCLLTWQSTGLHLSYIIVHT
jgi:SNF2 family DNA or RNA helicase